MEGGDRFYLHGNEGLAVFARDAPEDDGEGGSGARRILLLSSLQNQDTQLKNFNIKEIVLRLHTGFKRRSKYK